MKSPVWSIGVVGLACLPLLALTVTHFRKSKDELPSVSAYESPNLDRFDTVRKSMEERLGEMEKPAAGESADGEAVSAAELAETLAEAVLACSGTSRAAIESVATRLRTLTDRLAEVEKVRPGGPQMAEAVRRRSDEVDKRMGWLRSQEDIKKILDDVEQRITGGQDVDSQAACCTSLESVLRQYPGNALTQPDKERVAVLRGRAEFRRTFFALKNEAEDGRGDAVALGKQKDKWDRLLEKPLPASGDESLVKQAQSLRAAVNRRYLREDAIAQATARAMLTRVRKWLSVSEETAQREGSRFDSTNGQDDIVKAWLERHVAPLPKVEFESGIQEGVRAGENKTRILAFLKPIEDAPSQYRWWKSKGDMSHRLKSQGIVILVASPREPVYAGMFGKYTALRAGFLRDGYLTKDAAREFAGAVATILGDYEAYRQEFKGDAQDFKRYWEVKSPDAQNYDDTAAPWGNILERSQKCVDDFVAVRFAEDSASR